MAEITVEAYQDLRDYIQSSWEYIELQDETGTPIVRLSPTDERVTWIHTTNNQTLQLQVIIKGSDNGISLPQTFAKSVIYNVATGGEPFSVEEFELFTMTQEEDQLTVTHNIEVPQVTV